ncbi:MAG: hypothetical protein M3R25_07135 [Bacteroidota bacterium]|nr:hypothetical protein [Bacteroidota bacterium]
MIRTISSLSEPGSIWGIKITPNPAYDEIGITNSKGQAIEGIQLLTVEAKQVMVEAYKRMKWSGG